MQETLEQLKQQQKALSAQIKEIELAEVQARNQSLVGKCFKFRNRLACVGCEDDYWWTFFKVLGLDGTGFTVFSFERRSDGSIRIESQKRMPVIGSINTEITDAEFQQQYDILISQLNSLVR